MLINCSECGKQISDKALTCPNCGAPVGGIKEKDDARNDQFLARIERIERERYERDLQKSDKSRLAFILLGLVLGFLGIHNFYLGKTGRGAGQLIMFSLGLLLCSIGVGFLAIVIEAIWILVEICSVSTDANGKSLS